LFLKIEKDFDRKFPDYKERLMKSWNVNFEKFFYYFKKSLCTGDSIHETLMHAQNLKLGVYLCITNLF